MGEPKHPLRPIIKAFGDFTKAINGATDALNLVARATVGKPMARVGDLIRVTGRVFNFGYQQVPIGTVGVVHAVNPQQAYGGVHVTFPDGSVAQVHLYGIDENAEYVESIVDAIGGISSEDT